MTKEERKARRKADRALLWTIIFQATAAYSVDPDKGKWLALAALGDQLGELGRERAAET